MKVWLSFPMWTTRGGFASETRLVNSQLVTPPYPRSPIPLYNRNAVTWFYPDCSVLSYFIHSIPFLILSISKKCCVAQLSQGGSVFPCATRGRQGTCKATGLTVLRSLWNFVDQHCWRVGAGPNRQMSRGAWSMSATTGDRQSEIEHCLALKAPRNEVGIAQDVQVKDCSAPLSVGTSKSHHFIPCAATCCLFLGARVIPSQIHEDHEATMSTYPRPSASPSSKIRLVMVTDGHGLILVIDSVNVRLVMALVADPCALCPCARPKDQISMTSIDKLRRLRSFGIWSVIVRRRLLRHEFKPTSGRSCHGKPENRRKDLTF